MGKRIFILFAVIAYSAITGEAQTVYQKDRWGAAVYYFDFTPEWWQIASLVLM